MKREHAAKEAIRRETGVDDELLYRVAIELQPEHEVRTTSSPNNITLHCTALRYVH